MFQHFQAMKTSGTMDGAYFVSRQELLTYVNSALNTNEYTKVEQCGNGVAYLLMLHDILTSLAHAESLLAPLPSQQRPYHPPPPAPLPPGSPVPFGPAAAAAAAAGGSAFDGWQAGSAGTAGAGGGGLRTPLTGGGSVVSFRGAAGSSSISAGAFGGGSVAGAAGAGKPNPLLALAGAIMARMKKRARSEFEATHNLKLLQDMLGRLGVQRAVEVDKLARGVYQANLEFLQWFVRFAKNAKANEEAVLMQQSYPQQAAAIAATTTTTASATRASSSQNAGVSPSGGSTFRQPSPSGQRSTSASALDPQQPQQDAPPPPFRPHHSQQGGSARSGCVVAAPAPTTSDVMGSSVSSMPTIHAATVAFTAPVDGTNFSAGGVSGIGPLSGRVGSSASGAVSNPTSGRQQQQQQMGESGPHFHVVHAGPPVGPVVATSSVGFSGRAHSMNSNSGNTFTDPMNPVVPLLNTSTASARSSVSRTSGHAEATAGQLVGSRLPPPAYQHQQQRPHTHQQTPPSVPAVSSVPPPAHISTMGTTTTTTYHTDSISIDVGGAIVGSAAHNGGGGLFSASSSTYGPLDPPGGVIAGSSRGLLGSGGLTIDESHNPNIALPGNVGIIVEEGVPAPHRPPLLHQHGQARRALNAEAAGALHHPHHQQQLPQQLRGNRSPSGRSSRSIGSARSPSPSSPMGLGALQTTTGVSGVVSYHRNQSAASNGVQRQHSLSGSPRTSQQHLLNQRLFVGVGGGAEGPRRESVDYVGGSVGLRATSLDLVGEPPVAASSRMMMMMSGRVSSSAAAVSASNVSISDTAASHEGGSVGGGGAGGIVMRGAIGGAVAVEGGVAAFSDELTDAPLRPSSRSTSATDRGAAPKVNSDHNNVRSAVSTSLFGVSSGATSRPQQLRASVSVTSHSSYQTAQPLSLNQQTILSDDGEDMLVMTRPGGVARSPVPHAAVAPPRPITTSSGAAATVVTPPVVAAAPGVATNASTAGAVVTTSVTATRTATNPPTISGGSVVSSVSGGPLRGVPLATAPLGSEAIVDDVKAKDSVLGSKAIVASNTTVKPGAPVPRSFTFEQKTHPPTRPVDAPLASTSPLTGGGVIGGNTAMTTPAATSTIAARTVSASSAGLVPSTVFKSAPPPPALSTIISSSSSSQGRAAVAAAAASGKSAAITPPLVPITAPPATSVASISTAAVPVITASSNTAEIQARFYYDKLRAIELLVCDPQRTAALCGSSIGVVSARPLLAEITKILHAAS